VTIESGCAEFFQILLEQPHVPAALFRERLPPELFALLADVPPELVDTGREGERRPLGEVVFRLALLGGGEVFVCCLLEHRAPTPPVAVRALSALVRTWQWLARDRRQGALPVVVPLVVYHGPTPWTAGRTFSSLSHAPLGGGQLLDFELILVDLGAIEDGELSQLPVLKVGLLALKHATRGGGSWGDSLRRLSEVGVDHAFLLEQIEGAFPGHAAQLSRWLGAPSRA
jgi:hypothetical protein